MPPAWQIAKLRDRIRQARARGANPEDDGADLTHRALARAFRRGRADAARPRAGRRVLPARVQDILWRAVIDARIHDRTPTDAHRAIVAACQAIGERPPALSTVSSRVSFDRCPTDVLNRLGIDDPEPPAGDILLVAEDLVAACGAELARDEREQDLPRLQPPVIARTDALYKRSASQLERLVWPAAAIAEPAQSLFWHIRPVDRWPYAMPPGRGDKTSWTIDWSRSLDQGEHNVPFEVLDALPDHPVTQERGLLHAFIGYRRKVLAVLADDRRKDDLTAGVLALAGSFLASPPRQPDLGHALADLVIAAMRAAAASDIDLVAIIRARMDAT